MSFRQDWPNFSEWIIKSLNQKHLNNSDLNNLYSIFVKIMCLEYPKELLVDGTADDIHYSFTQIKNLDNLSVQEINIALKMIISSIEPFCKQINYIIDPNDNDRKGLIYFFKKLKIAKYYYTEELLNKLETSNIQFSICNLYLNRNIEGHGSQKFNPQDAISLFFNCVDVIFYIIHVNNVILEKSIILQNNKYISYNRIFPALEDIKKENLGPDEFELLEFLDKNLPKDEILDLSNISNYHGYLIFSQPYLNGLRPDIVVFNPQTGLQIIEVKAIDLTKYSYEPNDDDFIFSYCDTEILSPIKQVEHYKKKMIELLLPEIGEYIDKNEKAFGIIKSSLYFSKHETSEIKDFFKINKSYHDKSYFPIFGKDKLNQSSLNFIIPDISLKNKSIYWKKEWNKSILFWLLPPKHTKHNCPSLYELDKDQRRILNLENEHIRIKGIAGSGKSTLLANIAAKSLSQKKKVLLLSYNITLWHYLRDNINRTNYEFEWTDILFNHFHGFCKDILIKTGTVIPNNNEEDYFNKEYPQYTKKALETLINSGEKISKFDIIIVDEGQDFCYEWYDLLLQVLKENSNSFIIALDKNQNIYNRDLGWLDLNRNPWVRLRNEGKIRFKAGYENLLSDHRLSPKIRIFADQFASDFNIDSDIKLKREDLKDKYNPLLFDKLDDSVITWNNLTNEEQLFDIIYKIVINFGNQLIHPSDITVLLPSHEIGRKFVKFMKNKNYDVNHVFSILDEKNHKKSFWMGDGRLKSSTIHSFKGWECENVIIYIPEEIYDSVVSFDKIIFTAITRSKKRLCILNYNNRYEKYQNDFKPFENLL